MKKATLLWKTIFLFISFLLISCSFSHTKTIYLQGYIDARYIYISRPVSGYLQHLSVYRGNDVTAGQLLAELDPSPEIEQLGEAQKELESAKQELLDRIKGTRETILLAIMAKERQNQANLLLAKQDLDRKKYLYERNIIAKAAYYEAVAKYESTRQEVEESKANYAEAIQGSRENKILEQKATVDAQQANVDRLKWYVSQKKIYAPVNAHVFDTYYEEGEFIPSGQLILSLLSPKEIRVVFFLPEKDLHATHLGTSITLTCDGCVGKTKAKVNYISTQAEYTPPVIYSRETREKLVYRIEAIMPEDAAKFFHHGQPVTVKLQEKTK